MLLVAASGAIRVSSAILGNGAFVPNRVCVPYLLYLVGDRVGSSSA